MSWIPSLATAVTEGVSITFGFRHFHCFKDIAAGQVNSRCRLKIQFHIGFIGRYQGIDNPGYIAAGQEVGFQRVPVKLQAGFRSRDQAVDNDCHRYFPPPHDHQLKQGYPDSGYQRFKPYPDGDEIKNQPDGKDGA